MSFINCPPAAGNFMESMRGSGYTMASALADIIDNSISAGAKTVWVQAVPEREGSEIVIRDDGHGMSQDELIQAMTLAGKSSTLQREQHDLGRFGLGLKTASFSQCRRLTVLTKRKNKVAVGATWDLDVLEEKGWNLELHESIEHMKHSKDIGDCGTVVLWENIDRVEGMSEDSDDVRLANPILEAAKNHLELVFHRFLQKNADATNIDILFNNTPIEPNDPFLEDHPASTVQGSESIPFRDQGTVEVKAFTIPHPKKIRNATQRMRSEIDGGHIKNQGVYIYRSKRLIMYGGWLGLAPSTAMTKLARVKVDIPASFDFEWKVDIRKASAQVPLEIKNKLKPHIEKMTQGSKRVYRYKGRITNASSKLDAYWLKRKHENTTKFELNVEHPAAKECLESVANPLQRQQLLQYLIMVGATVPVDSIFVELSDRETEFSQGRITRESLEHEFDRCWKSLHEKGIPKEEIILIMRQLEPFRTNELDSEDLFKRAL